MINLIPFDARQHISTEYWARVVVVWLYLVAAAAVIVGMLLFPAYILITSQIQAYEVSVTQATERIGAFEQGVALLSETSGHARLVAAMANTASVMSAYDRLSALEGQWDLDVAEYVVRQNDGVVRAVDVKGVAATRFVLTEYRDALRADPLVTKVDFPISSLARDRDIPFALLITLSAASSTTP